MTYKKWGFKALHTDTNVRKRDAIMTKLHTETCKIWNAQNRLDKWHPNMPGAAAE